VSPNVQSIRRRLLPVKDRSGETLYYVTTEKATRMIKGGRVIALGTKQTIRALQIAPNFDDSKVTTLSAYAGQRYSSKADTDINPAGCWDLKRLAKRDRPVFRRVVLDCIADWRISKAA